MASLNNSVLGEVSGKLGNKVFRKMYGKTVVSERPLHYKAAKTPAARKVRKSFGMSVKLAKTLIADPTLNEIWTAANIEGVNSNQRIIKHNIRLFDGGSLTPRNIMSPGGLFLKVDSASYENQNIHLTMNCPAENNLNFPADLFILYYFEKENKSLVLTKTTIQESAAGGIYELAINPGKYISRLLDEGSEPMLLVALVSKTASKKKPYWTNTDSVNISLS